MSAQPEAPRRLTVGDIAKRYADGQRIPMLTAYDFPTAKLLDEAGIPFILVGDSLGRVILGYENEIPVSMAPVFMVTPRKPPMTRMKSATSMAPKSSPEFQTLMLPSSASMP